MQATEFDAVLEIILKKDSRYHRDAYHLVREALELTKNQVHKNLLPDQKEKHVSGQQLLEGIRQFALQQFGPMATTVFEEWGVRSCRDFGEIVFNMVEIGLLAKTEKDSRDDFENGYDFTEAFLKPFRPQSKMKTVTKPASGCKTETRG
jgi:uncharacterized repeat protein (TIGR04138 family)